MVLRFLTGPRPWLVLACLLLSLPASGCYWVAVKGPRFYWDDEARERLEPDDEAVQELTGSWPAPSGAPKLKAEEVKEANAATREEYDQVATIGQELGTSFTIPEPEREVIEEESVVVE